MECSMKTISKDISNAQRMCEVLNEALTYVSMYTVVKINEYANVQVLKVGISTTELPKIDVTGLQIN